MSKPVFPLNNCDPTPEEYEALKKACVRPTPPNPPAGEPFPTNLNAAPNSAEYQRLLAAARGELNPLPKKKSAQGFQMTVDVDFDSPEYEQIKRQNNRTEL